MHWDEVITDSGEWSATASSAQGAGRGEEDGVGWIANHGLKPVATSRAPKRRRGEHRDRPQRWPIYGGTPSEHLGATRQLKKGQGLGLALDKRRSNV